MKSKPKGSPLDNESFKYIYIYIFIYLFIRGVTVHSIHGSVRCDTVVSRFDMGEGTIGFLSLRDQCNDSCYNVLWLCMEQTLWSRLHC